MRFERHRWGLGVDGEDHLAGGIRDGFRPDLPAAVAREEAADDDPVAGLDRRLRPAVRFEIDRSGSAQNVRVVRSSGDDQLDTSAVRAVEAANPLPWVYGALEVPVHFELSAPR